MKTICLTAAIAALTSAAPAGAVSGNAPANSWVTDGAVYAIAATPRQVYIGGSFTLIGPKTGSWVGVSAAGAVARPSPRFDESVIAAVSDGADGWLVATADANYGTHIAHVQADRTLDPKWHITTNGTINALARQGTTLFIAGDFTKVSGTKHARLVAIDVAKRRPLAWDPGVTAKKVKGYASVYQLALSQDGKTLYFAGEFARVRGAARRGLAAVDTATAKVQPWKPWVDGDVYDLTVAPDGQSVFIAGDYVTIDGKARAELGSVTAKTGAVTAWDPKANGAISTVEPGPQGWPLYVGGTFTSVGG